MAVCKSELIEYMDSGRLVRVIDVNGQQYVDQCWYYDKETSKAKFGINEPCLDVGSHNRLLLSETASIEYYL